MTVIMELCFICFQLLRLRTDATDTMSSVKKDGSSSRSKPPSGNKQGTVPSSASTMKESKIDNSSMPSDKAPAFSRKPVNSPLSKSHYLSKSHESLTSHQKQRLVALESRPKSSLGLPDTKKKGMSNKENVQLKDKDGFLKPKAKIGLTSTPIRKASSSQHIDKSGSSQAQKATPNGKINMKRAHSTQNVCKDKAVKKRTSATPDVMAYNAELLANFEKEKKVWEAKHSEQIQIAESRKVDIEKYKYEIKQLKEQIPSHDVQEELDILRAENAKLKEQLIKLGFHVEAQITDSEKLSLKKQTQKEAESGMMTSASYDSLSTDGQPVSMVQGMLLVGEGGYRDFLKYICVLNLH